MPCQTPMQSSLQQQQQSTERVAELQGENIKLIKEKVFYFTITILCWTATESIWMR